MDDGVHPSGSGRARISALLHERFMREAWYRLIGEARSRAQASSESDVSRRGTQLVHAA